MLLTLHTRKTIFVTFLLVSIIAVGFIPVRVIATTNVAVGVLDTTFDMDGLVTISKGNYLGSAAVAIQPDGRIVIGGTSSSGYDDFAVVRINADGSMDTSFDGDGIAVTNFGNFCFDSVRDLILQPDGKIILAGTSINASGANTFALARYNSDGSLDTSFDGDGKVTTDNATVHDYPQSVALQSDGKILFVGSVYFNSQSDIALIRYNVDGTLDTTFGINGTARTDINNQNDKGFDLFVLPDDKILVGGTTYPNRNQMALLRYNSNGSLDTSFDGDGIVTASIGVFDTVEGDIIVQDGKITLTGYGSQLQLVRFNLNGSLDTSFDQDGVLIRDLTEERFSDLALQSNGKLLLAGNKKNTDHDFALMRLNSDGSLDTSFGMGGIVSTDFGSGTIDIGAALAVQSDNKIVVAGLRQVSSSISEMAIARYIGIIPPPTVTPTQYPYIIPTTVPPTERPKLVSNAVHSASPYSTSGTTSGSPSSLSQLDQSEADDDPAAYVSFQTPDGSYLGYQSFSLPEDAQTRLISTMLLQLNFKGPASSTQVWTWSIYNPNSNLWIKIGDSIGTEADQWQNLVFRIRQPWRFVSPGNEIRIQLKSNNANGDAKIDYQALHVTYLSIPAASTPVTPPVAPKRPGIFSLPK